MASDGLAALFTHSVRSARGGRIKAQRLWSGLMLPTAFTAVSYWLLPFAASLSTLYQAGSFSLNISSNSFRGLPVVCLTAFMRANGFQCLPTHHRAGSPLFCYLYPGILSSVHDVKDAHRSCALVCRCWPSCPPLSASRRRARRFSGGNTHAIIQPRRALSHSCRRQTPACLRLSVAASHSWRRRIAMPSPFPSPRR